MGFKRINFLVLVLAGFASTFSHAYDQKGCMQGIDVVFDVSQRLADANMNLLSMELAQGSVGNDADNSVVTHLNNGVDVVLEKINSAYTISILRQGGNFKQTKYIDSIVSLHFKQLFRSVQNAKERFTKYTGSIKNYKLKMQAFATAQELEKISLQLAKCEKIE